MSCLTKDLKEELEREYFLVSKRAFIGGFLAILLALGVFSFTTAKTATERVISKWSEGVGMERIKAAQEVADELVASNRGVPSGSILLLSKDRNCPPGSQRLADFAIQTNRTQTQLHSKTIAVTNGDTSWDVNANNWDGLTFKTCLLN